ncbi:hypothetical protein [Microbacterium sp. H6]|uniref:hypothetical protein n=1 Tax=Microbacterium sp. H6 TaxID=421122 RepID=UPI000DE2D8C4|nr:hypothetical protein [Microbacterium sp. H6]RBO73476.1 hypothetical protein DSP71_04795 [Microbacterium sp. H6]
MTEAIVWGVIWLILTFGGAWLIYALFALGGVGLAAATDKLWIAPILVGIGIIGAIAWFVFGAVHTVLQIIDVIRLATGG